MLTNLKHFIAYSMPTFKEHPLWAEDRLSPFLRFAQLQFRFLVTNDTIRLPWINNLVLPLKRGDRGLTGNFYLGLWEFNDMAFAIHLLRKDDIFLDIGANLGSYSLLASGVANAKSIAYEPVPHTYQKLMRSIIENNLTDRITARQVALTSPGTASDHEEVYFSTDKDCENSFVTADYAGDRISISCSTLDKEAFGLSPTLLKIDVEGFEGDVLQGASEVLANRSVLAVIIEGQTSQVNTIFYEAGFKDYQYLPLKRKLVARERYTQNRIWVRTDALDEVISRLLTAPTYSVYGKSF